MDSADTWGRSRGRLDRRWQLTRHPDAMRLSIGGRSRNFAGDALAKLSVRRGWIRNVLHVADTPPLKLTGLNRRDARSINEALDLLRARHRALPALEAARQWREKAKALEHDALRDGRWLPHEAVDDLRARHPGPEVVNALRRASDVLASLPAEDARAVEFLDVDLTAWAGELNETILSNEMRDRAKFFATVESRPLTDEQIRAVVCLDNRVHVIASAGSGKTSVMVARAAYAIMRGFVQPDHVLLLAFNRNAADELRSRVTARLDALGLPSDGVLATTFHSFGLQVIGDAIGKKPRLADWLDGDQDIDMVGRIVDELRDRSPDFAYRWDLFRLLYSRASGTPDGGEPDGYDKATRRTGFRTARGETVKSEGERMIADWLFFNGVHYEYERRFERDTADRVHSQYKPDFFYPDLNVWHEHWALDHAGRPPESFHGYAESMSWKKRLHANSGTTLIETTWAEIMNPGGLERLGQELRAHGAVLDWNPDREAPGLKPLRHEDLARLVRTFMAHVKSNSLDRGTLEERVRLRTASPLIGRTMLFIGLYWQIHDEWQARLRTEDAVDFEDMLVEAAAHLEDGAAVPLHDLVMVDEFQDASQARARLIRALVAPARRYLLAVGDDWQSINRFAGADISVMTEFERWFGPGPTLRLQTTFRCSQSISDVASAFVSKNPRQLRKEVVSASTYDGAAVRLFRVSEPVLVSGAIKRYLDELAGRIQRGEEAPGRDGRVSVFVLGRYRFDRDLLPRGKWANVDVTFRTAHGSKGLEADYILLPNLTRARYGFPSNIVDDPVLDLVMADPDTFPHAEERRLFYVALTRARRGVALLAIAGQESPFVVELVDEGLVTLEGDEEVSVRVCPACKQGTLVLRRGPYSEFLGCSGFPRCRYTTRRASATSEPSSR